MALQTLRTKVRNISGEEKYFSFLPPHGVTLAAGEERTFRGDLGTLLAGRSRKGKYEAFIHAQEEELLALVSTPSQHYYDPTLAQTVVLEVDNGAVTIIDPEAGPYSSSE